jgi:GMP synthase-like glutamine amidotransferase
LHVLLFRHVPFEGAGRIHDVLSARGIEIRVCDRAAVSPEAAVQAAGLIFMGGPMSVNDDLPYLRHEELLIREAIGRGAPVLGICLGAQLIARALGARVHANPVKEIGWFDVHPCEAAAGDALFSTLGPTETVFHWHGEMWDLPSSGTLLASSAACRHQAFRFGRNVYGVQFHLEATPEMIADWQRQDENCGDVRELSGPIDPLRNSARLSFLAQEMFGRWADLLYTSGLQDR